MAHGLLIEDGEAAMMYAQHEPWHGLGTKLDHPPTAEEAIKAARLDWEVRCFPLSAVADGITHQVKGAFVIAPAHKWKDVDCPIFGTVTARYTPLQNRDAFRFFDPIVGEGAAIYETAGALGKGERVWILAKLPDDIRVAGDDITRKYLLLSNSHDGKSSVQVKFTPTRVVCQNTLVQALDGEGETLRIPHTRDMPHGLDEARRNLRLIHAQYAEIEKVFQEMARTRMNQTRLTMYMKLVFPDPRDPRDTRGAEQAWKHRETAEYLFEHGKGNRLKSVAGSLWCAYNGVAEFMDHGPSKRDAEHQLKFIWFGKGAKVKARALAVATKQMAEWRGEVR